MNKLKLFPQILLILLMSIGLNTFTSCSGDNDDDDDYGLTYEISSSSEKASSSSNITNSSSSENASSSSDKVSSSSDKASSSSDVASSSSSENVSSSSDVTSSSSLQQSSSSIEPEPSSSSLKQSSSSAEEPSSSSIELSSSSSLSLLITEGNSILCLGNSLTVGYGAGNEIDPIDINKSYPAYFSEKVNIPVINLGVSGLTAADAAASIEDKEQEISEAKIIIIELGANDFFDKVKSLVGDVEGGNYLKIASIIMNGFPVDFIRNSVEKDMETILNYIRSKNTFAKIYLAKFYNNTVIDDLNEFVKSINPIPTLTLPSLFNPVGLEYNAMFAYLEQNYDVEIIEDIWKNVWGNEDMIYPDIEIMDKSFGIHANSEGYKIMADNYFNAMSDLLNANSLVR